eukprot:m.109332 g.109332  ORF g.109332 m.109332 type:complete len:580 (+) comp9038_c0_seq3:1578-3317(+)
MGTDSMMTNFVSGVSRSGDAPQDATADVAERKMAARHPRVWARLVLSFPSPDPSIVIGRSLHSLISLLPPKLNSFFSQQLQTCRPFAAITIGSNLVGHPFSEKSDSELGYIAKMAQLLYAQLIFAKPQMMENSQYRDTGAFCLYLSPYAEDNWEQVLHTEVMSSASSHFTTNLDTNLIVSHFGMARTNSLVACIPSDPVLIRDEEVTKRQRFAKVDVKKLVTESGHLFKVVTFFPKSEMLLWLAIMFGSVADMSMDVFQLYTSLCLGTDTRIKLTPVLPNIEQAIKPDGTVNEVCTLFALAGATTISRSLSGIAVRDWIRESLKRLGFKTDISVLDLDCFRDFQDAYHPLCVPPEMAQFDEFAKVYPDANFAVMYRPVDSHRIDVMTMYLGESTVKRKRGSAVDKDRADDIDAKTFSEGVTAFIENGADIHYYVANSFQDSYPSVNTAELAPTTAFLIVNAVDETFTNFRLDEWRPFPDVINKIFINVPVYGRKCDDLLPILQRLGFARTERPMLQRAELAAFLHANRTVAVVASVDLPESLPGLQRTTLFQLMEWATQLVKAAHEKQLDLHRATLQSA